jgi:transposase
MYELAELFSIGRSTVYRAAERAHQRAGIMQPGQRFEKPN